jgi:ATP synthase protein I
MKTPDTSTSELEKRVERQARRMQKAARERPTLFAQTAYIGVLGMLLVLPVVGGAYLGLWLDRLSGGYSFRWTLSLIVLGVVVGSMNVYLYIKD